MAVRNFCGGWFSYEHVQIFYILLLWAIIGANIKNVQYWCCNKYSLYNKIKWYLSSSLCVLCRSSHFGSLLFAILELWSLLFSFIFHANWLFCFSRYCILLLYFRKILKSLQPKIFSFFFPNKYKSQELTHSSASLFNTKEVVIEQRSQTGFSRWLNQAYRKCKCVLICKCKLTVITLNSSYWNQCVRISFVIIISSMFSDPLVCFKTSNLKYITKTIIHSTKRKTCA